ncbi:MAG: DUF5320 domain-containing protein [Bacilli bacterium]|nr:DUF5320 domain-containing protein [Bacilli bacterium]
MPRYDGTGPTGLGEMTGRGLGNCQNKKTTNDQFQGRRSRDLFCMRRFWRRNRLTSYQGRENIDEKEFLKNRINFLENELLQMKKQLLAMETEKED